MGYCLNTLTVDNSSSLQMTPVDTTHVGHIELEL